MAEQSEGSKYEAIIMNASKTLVLLEKKRKKADDDDDPDFDDSEIPTQYELDLRRKAVERHKSFLPFVKAGLLPASIAIRIAIEGKSAIDEVTK